MEGNVMAIKAKNLGRMELAELINHLAEVKAAINGPGPIALTICECCINVTMPDPGEDVLANLEVVNPKDRKEAIALSIK